VTASFRDEAHLSIGEVLAHLQDEFPDVTVSKIRFLESQGLIDPERTPSGYRRFYGPDLERLRWILYQQREHFLPLRVIKERLDEFGRGGAPPLEVANGDRPAVPDDVALTPGRVFHLDSALTLPLERTAEPLDDGPSRPDAPPEPDARVAPGVSVAPTDTPTPTGQLTRVELLRESQLGDHALEELEAFGLITHLGGGGDAARYDEEALEIAQAAAPFYARGITARHLRMYQHFADREADLLMQVLLPYRRQRNPIARARRQAEFEELARSGAQLRTLMLRRVLRDQRPE
jgi:DNA-binding transcriptional MerR regulator